jgi:hypothetical protein
VPHLPHHPSPKAKSHAACLALAALVVGVGRSEEKALELWIRSPGAFYSFPFFSILFHSQGFRVLLWATRGRCSILRKKMTWILESILTVHHQEGWCLAQAARSSKPDSGQDCQMKAGASRQVALERQPERHSPFFSHQWIYSMIVFVFLTAEFCNQHPPLLYQKTQDQLKIFLQILTGNPQHRSVL